MAEARLDPTSHPPRTLAAGALLLTLCLGACSGVGPKAAVKREPPPERMVVPGTVTGAAIQLDFRPLGSVATDGVTLPVLSPSGRYLAVQTGVAPDLATALARPGQRPPLASRIALYRLEPRGIVRLGETDGGLILGRNASDQGVLVESVRPDGARWIGRLDWNTQEVEWLVQDGAVNAFASIAADGTLAYCSRALQDRHFDLVVRREDSTRRLPADGARSYLMPALSGDGSRVFALVVRDGILELASADPASTESLAQSLVRVLVTDRGNDELALFMCSAQGVRDGIDGRDWILFHRTVGSLARWNADDGLRPVRGGAMAMARVDATREAVLVGGKVRVRAIDSEPSEPGTVVVEQLAVPRALGELEGKPAFVLLSPEGSTVRVVLARIVN